MSIVNNIKYRIYCFKRRLWKKLIDEIILELEKPRHRSVGDPIKPIFYYASNKPFYCGTIVNKYADGSYYNTPFFRAKEIK
jgi:hypothetical protein